MALDSTLEGLPRALWQKAISSEEKLFHVMPPRNCLKPKSQYLNNYFLLSQDVIHKNVQAIVAQCNRRSSDSQLRFKKIFFRKLNPPLLFHIFSIILYQTSDSNIHPSKDKVILRDYC